ncbi:MAG: regulatory signaling modulator protein AmpE [Pseudomonas sp.]|nr:regulatory signaling modulator protein AmpE [Pseudomonas sp.]
MSFLVLAIVVLILRFTPWRHGFPLDLVGWWTGKVGSAFGVRPVWQTLTLLALPPLVAALLLWWVRGELYGLLTLLAHVGLVMLAVGRNDALGSMAAPFDEAWQRGDREAAYHVARRDLALDCEGSDELLKAVDTRIALAAFRDYVAPIFWYLLLGPVAALGYRLLEAFSRMEGHPAQPSASRAAHALEWVPVRLFALSLALVGDFERGLRALRRWLLLWEAGAQQVMASCLVAALGREQQANEPGKPVLQSVRTILVRSFVVWAVCIAFVSLLG